MTPTQRGVEHGPVAMPTPGWTNACRGCDKTWPHPTQPTPREVPVREPRTKAGKALLERESLNSRSFALIRPEEIVAIEQEATRAVLVEVLRSGDDIFDVVHRLAAE